MSALLLNQEQINHFVGLIDKYVEEINLHTGNLSVNLDQVLEKTNFHHISKAIEQVVTIYNEDFAQRTIVKTVEYWSSSEGSLQAQFERLNVGEETIEHIQVLENRIIDAVENRIHITPPNTVAMGEPFVEESDYIKVEEAFKVFQLNIQQLRQTCNAELEALIEQNQFFQNLRPVMEILITLQDEFVEHVDFASKGLTEAFVERLGINILNVETVLQEQTIHITNNVDFGALSEGLLGSSSGGTRAPAVDAVGSEDDGATDSENDDGGNSQSTPSTTGGFLERAAGLAGQVLAGGAEGAIRGLNPLGMTDAIDSSLDLVEKGLDVLGSDPLDSLASGQSAAAKEAVQIDIQSPQNQSSANANESTPNSEQSMGGSEFSGLGATVINTPNQSVSEPNGEKDSSANGETQPVTPPHKSSDEEELDEYLARLADRQKNTSPESESGAQSTEQGVHNSSPLPDEKPDTVNDKPSAASVDKDSLEGDPHTQPGKEEEVQPTTDATNRGQSLVDELEQADIGPSTDSDQIEDNAVSNLAGLETGQDASLIEDDESLAVESGTNESNEEASDAETTHNMLNLFLKYGVISFIVLAVLTAIYQLFLA
ncbi:hypothetical protein [Sporosarcina sp. FA9]|uniref:hypothetical protein n=1 Tax=Sporosarcina sp. FA9 TaxID=3413030 RepID=UPI003F65655E